MVPHLFTHSLVSKKFLSKNCATQTGKGTLKNLDGININKVSLQSPRKIPKSDLESLNLKSSTFF